MELERYRILSRMARGLEKAELVFKNANVFFSHTGEFVPCDVAVADGKILGTGTYEGHKEIDLSGRYLCPGFIDSHLHLESTLVTPPELISQAVRWGTTTFIVDPHEAANVSGTDGIDYILEQTETVPANVYVMMPSCVPSTNIDDNGASLTAGKMKNYLENPRILGLGEVMDASSVVEGSVSMHEKLALFHGKVRDGHAPFLSPGDLNAYRMAGITTDHECVDYAYAMEECRRGIQVLIREGSAARNLEAIVKGIVENGTDTEGFCFCTDDKHIEEIQREGHINCNIKKAVKLGLPVEKALKMATIQAARCYGLSHLGAIAPGCQADLVVLSDLESLEILEVYHKGVKIQRDRETEKIPCAPKLKNTVHILNFTKDRLKLSCTSKYAHVIEMTPGQITTLDKREEVPCIEKNGEKEFEPNRLYQKIAVIERHKYTGKMCQGIVKGFGIRGGAIASSVSHDSHNIIVVGDNDEDMYLAVKELVRTQGGYTIAEGGRIFETLPLPVMGLISDAGYEKVHAVLSRMLKKAHEMGIGEGFDPFISLSFLALPVIPEIRITPRGIYLAKEDRMLKSPFDE
ncbi:MAG TPA: adenine deaminase [Candidatus Blautia faecigallinarum]|uniref:Adenine deaminase n=1 Tax=Candidatus Blautia faecigallinarum TaxID=2838488 RepID=A0A9D2DT25_9FIRM|nr:adenine deaminase [Candidatus Blautia faecigallinarum]